MGVSQENLARTIFPLGNLTKPRIREMASEFGLDEVAKKPDSYEICFVPDNNYRRFLRDRVPDMDQKAGPGNFLLSDGTVMGQHEGYPFYTIGQRHGLGLAVGEPIYVTRIDAKSNTVWVGPKEELLGQRLTAAQINPIKYADLTGERDAAGKIRYKDEGAPCCLAGREPPCTYSLRSRAVLLRRVRPLCCTRKMCWWCWTTTLQPERLGQRHAAS